MKTLSRFLRLAALLAAAAALSSSQCRQAPSRPEATSSTPEIVAIGLLQQGIECMTLRTEDGKLFAISGDLQGYKPGDKVCVKGRRAGESICMQGEATVEVQFIGPADACP